MIDQGNLYRVLEIDDLLGERFELMQEKKTAHPALHADIISKIIVLDNQITKIRASSLNKKPVFRKVKRFD